MQANAKGVAGAAPPGGPSSAAGSTGQTPQRLTRAGQARLARPSPGRETPGKRATGGPAALRPRDGSRLDAQLPADPAGVDTNPTSALLNRNGDALELPPSLLAPKLTSPGAVAIDRIGTLPPAVREYLKCHVLPVTSAMVRACVREQPDDPAVFFLQYLEGVKKERNAKHGRYAGTVRREGGSSPAPGGLCRLNWPLEMGTGCPALD